MKKQVYLLSIVALVFLVLSCANTTYIEKNYSKNLQKLKNSPSYESNTVQLTKEYMVHSSRAKEIRDYFKANANLDLDALAASENQPGKSLLSLQFLLQKIFHMIIKKNL